MSRINGRASLGGAILRDAGNRFNTNTSIRASPGRKNRRVSFGGGHLNVNNNNNNNNLDSSFDGSILSENSGTGGTMTSGGGGGDMRAKLEAWRAERRVKEAHSSSYNSNDENSGSNSQQLPLPPSSSSSSLSSGTTAVERFRLRRLQREKQAIGASNKSDDTVPQQQQQQYQQIHPTPPLPPSSSLSTTMTTISDCKSITSSSSAVIASTSSMTTTEAFAMSYNTGSSSRKTNGSICFDDEPVNVITTRSRMASSPSRNRRMTLSGGARRRGAAKGRKSMLPPPSSFNSIFDDNTDTSTTTATTAFVETVKPNDSTISEPKNTIDQLTVVEMENDINEPGLRSKITQMEKRIHQLEEEKMSISMSKAPLEARLRHKEDQWTKEQTKYEQEVSSLMVTSKETNDKMKSLEMEFESLQEENRKLKFQARKQKHIDESEKENSENSNDVWNRQLQNDRDVAELKEKLKDKEEEIRNSRLEKVSLQSTINGQNIEISALERDLNELQTDYEDLLIKTDSNADAEIQLEELKKEHTAATAQLNATSGELASLKSQSKYDMEMKEKQWEQEKEKLLFDMSVMKSRAGNNLEQDISDADIVDEAVLRARIEERDRRIVQLEVEVLKGEQIRRDMHNRIQELRGNIRVYVRTRPFLPGDNGETVSSINVLPDGENLSIENHSKNHDYKFDKVFAPSAGQEIVFGEVSEFVQSALDGYHVCLFSYGQTGSGKTHTMQGSGNGAMRGIIPRAVEQILNQVQQMKKQKWTFNVTASFLEIYNEELKDLLVSMNGSKVSKADQLKLSIRREKSGKSYVSNLTKIFIDTEDIIEGMQGLKKVMASAARSRSVACTKMNSVSSRSHSVFMLHLSGTNEENGTMVQGALNLCDLAGSERLDRSGAGSDAKRLKETQSINKSLSCLGDVFTSLSNGSSHIPFRNSKLTYLLQDCLSGDGKALMFVNLSPSQTSSNESLCSLRFAQRVNQVELGKATKHVQYRTSSR